MALEKIGRCGRKNFFTHLAPVSDDPKYIHADRLSGIQVGLVTSGAAPGVFRPLVLVLRATAFGPGRGLFGIGSRTVPLCSCSRFF